MIYTWSYKNRVWFLEKDTTNAWYLGALNLTGAAVKLPLSGIFPTYSRLLFGAGWSTEAGDNLDERVIFVTEKGNLALYGGTPGTDLALQGVYNIGVPLGKHCHFQYGDDYYIGTTAGLVSMTLLINNKKLGRGTYYVSAPIDSVWLGYTNSIGPSENWRASVWSARSLAFIYNGEFENNIVSLGLAI